MNRDELIAFEKYIADKFNAGLIRAPIHLSGGNEDKLISIFKDFKKGDYCFSTWRNHYHALLADIPPEEVKRQIMAGRSMTICSPEHRFFSSAIFAGCCPIALGVAWQIKRSGGNEKVFIFIGDMCGLSGLVHECKKYSTLWGLPLHWICEDNGKSVCTNTKDVWGYDNVANIPFLGDHYVYELPWPHAGAGKRIQF